MRLASFDIFDTTLIRLFGRPENINVLLTGKEHSQGDALERQVESDNLIANPMVRDLINQKRMEGCQIAFISDMYLDSKFLSEILMREGCMEDGDKIYVSCEHNARKDTGTLYDLIRKELRPDEWDHYGDNRQSDVRMAKRKGIKAHWINTCFNDSEKSLLLAKENIRSGNILNVLAGISRAARLHFGNDAVSILSANVVAMVYIPFALWVFERAKKEGIKRLYFLSRDCYIIMKAAAVFAKVYDVDIKYLFVSRRCLYLPYIAGGSEIEYLEASDKHTIIRRDNVNKLLLHLGTSREELKDIYNIDFTYQRSDTQEEQHDFLEKIFHSSFTEELQKRAFKSRNEILSYFKQEGLFDNVKSAMVDVGWLGTTRLMINKILESAGIAPVSFLYFGVRRDTVSSIYGSFESYYGINQLNTSSTALIEHYLSVSPYPTTIGYQKDCNGIWTPIFPSGEKYTDTVVTLSNERIVTWIARNIKKLGITDDAVLFLCSKNAIESISERNIHIDLSPLFKIGNFDQWIFIKKFSAYELFSFLFLGKRVTEFDWGSLKSTLPMYLCSTCWKIHKVSRRLRGMLFKHIVVKRI